MFYLEKYATLLIREKDYIKAAHLLNSAHRIASDNKLDRQYQHRLLMRLESIEAEFIHELTGKKILSTYRGHLQKVPQATS